MGKSGNSCSLTAAKWSGNGEVLMFNKSGQVAAICGNSALMMLFK